MKKTKKKSSNQTLEQALQKLKIRENSESVLKMHGIKEPKMDTDLVPDCFPADITELDAEELGKLYGIYESYVAYIGFVCSSRALDVDAAGKVMNFLDEKLISQSKKPTLKEKKVEAHRNKQYRKWTKEHEVLLGEKKLLDASYEVYERYGKILSREISRRTGFMSHGGIGDTSLDGKDDKQDSIFKQH